MKKIFLELERCDGCLTCTLACAAEHSKSKSITGAMAEGIQPRLEVEAAGNKAVPVLCHHCEEPACVEACMTGAMKKDPESGLVTNEGHEQKCIGCWMCIMACPYGAIKQNQGREKVALKCDGCVGREIPACVDSCPNRALVYAEPDDFAETNRKRTALETVKAS